MRRHRNKKTPKELEFREKIRLLSEALLSPTDAHSSKKQTSSHYSASELTAIVQQCYQLSHEIKQEKIKTLGSPFKIINKKQLLTLTGQNDNKVVKKD